LTKAQVYGELNDSAAGYLVPLTVISARAVIGFVQDAIRLYAKLLSV
jgi:hypothetical protein